MIVNLLLNNHSNLGLLKKILIVFIIVFPSSLYPQLALNEWKSHFSYNKIIFLTETQHSIVAGNKLGLFYIDKTNQAIDYLSKINGLSDVNISSISYSTYNDCLLITYENGNIDLLKNNTVYNIPDFKIKSLIGNKAINNIYFQSNLAYLATNIGIIVIDLENIEIKETYFIGENGAYLAINSICVYDNCIYAVSNNEIKKASLNNLNLLNYQNWESIYYIENNNYMIKDIFVFDNQLFCLVNDNGTNKILKYNSIDFELWYEFDEEDVRIFVTELSLICTSSNKIDFLNKDALKIREINTRDQLSSGFVNYCLRDNSGSLWIADGTNGVFKVDNNELVTKILPNGPVVNTIGKLEYGSDMLIVTAGSKTLNGANRWYQAKISIYKDNEWKSIYNPNTMDYYSIAIDEFSNEHFFIGAWWKGIYEYENHELKNSFEFQSSSLTSHLPDQNYIHVSGLEFDQNNVLWSVNPSVSPINAFLTDGTWISYRFNNSISNIATGDLIVTQNNHKWINLPDGNGIFAFNDNYTPVDKLDDQYKRFQPINEEDGELIGSDISAIQEDLNGEIWIGTDEGVAVFYYPDYVFDENIFASRIKITEAVGDTLETQYLLSSEYITCIKVDGANQKWIGTRNSGAFLFNESGTREIYHFTKNNSPLISDYIIDIEIDDLTGEVFFATDIGIVSFRGEAIKGKNKFDKVYAFPNPVRETYTGPITITGLIDNTDVRITDLAGNLVYKTTSQGGQIVWNGKNSNNKRVKTGVYIALCSDENGNEQAVVKILVIN